MGSKCLLTRAACVTEVGAGGAAESGCVFADTDQRWVAPAGQPAHLVTSSAFTSSLRRLCAAEVFVSPSA